MGVNDLGIIGIGKDSYNEHLPGMIQENILPWVEDVQENGYPVWANYGAVQRSTYILDREGNLQNNKCNHILPEQYFHRIYSQ